MSAASDGALIVLTRDRRGRRDLLRSYLVMIDDAEVAKVRRGQRVELPVTPGHHEIFVKVDWCRSPKLDVDAQPGEVIELFCAPGGPATAGLGEVFAGAESYIELRRSEPVGEGTEPRH